jgi:nicotinamidase-related amidase
MRKPSSEDVGWASAIMDPLAPREDELVIDKARASAFFGTPIDAYLRRLGIDSLIVAGESTSGCVRATVVDAYSLGFDVMVVEEATFDRVSVSHKVNLFDMHHKYATVVSLEVALDYVRSVSRG